VDAGAAEALACCHRMMVSSNISNRIGCLGQSRLTIIFQSSIAISVSFAPSGALLYSRIVELERCLEWKRAVIHCIDEAARVNKVGIWVYAGRLLDPGSAEQRCGG